MYYSVSEVFGKTQIIYYFPTWRKTYLRFWKREWSFNNRRWEGKGVKVTKFTFASETSSENGQL